MLSICYIKLGTGSNTNSAKNLNKSQRKKVANYCMHALIGIKYIRLKSSKPSSLVCETACWIYFSVTKRLIIKLCTAIISLLCICRLLRKMTLTSYVCLYGWRQQAREVRISLLKLYTFFESSLNFNIHLVLYIHDAHFYFVKPTTEVPSAKLNQSSKKRTY